MGIQLRGSLQRAPRRAPDRPPPCAHRTGAWPKSDDANSARAWPAATRWPGGGDDARHAPGERREHAHRAVLVPHQAPGQRELAFHGFGRGFHLQALRGGAPRGEGDGLPGDLRVGVVARGTVALASGDEQQRDEPYPHGASSWKVSRSRLRAAPTPWPCRRAPHRIEFDRAQRAARIEQVEDAGCASGIGELRRFGHAARRRQHFGIDTREPLARRCKLVFSERRKSAAARALRTRATRARADSRSANGARGLALVRVVHVQRNRDAARCRRCPCPACSWALVGQWSACTPTVTSRVEMLRPRSRAASARLDAIAGGNHVGAVTSNRRRANRRARRRIRPPASAVLASAPIARPRSTRARSRSACAERKSFNARAASRRKRSSSDARHFARVESPLGRLGRVGRDGAELTLQPQPLLARRKIEECRARGEPRLAQLLSVVGVGSTQQRVRLRIAKRGLAAALDHLLEAQRAVEGFLAQGSGAHAHAGIHVGCAQGERGIGALARDHHIGARGIAREQRCSYVAATLGHARLQRPKRERRHEGKFAIGVRCRQEGCGRSRRQGGDQGPGEEGMSQFCVCGAAM